MPDYSKGKIYRLVCNVTGLEYIGHTTQPLSVRKGKHVVDFKRWKEGKQHYISSVKVMEHGDFDIFLIEDCPCDNVEQLRARERHWIESTEGRVNRYIPSRTKAEHSIQYRAENKERIAERKRAYFQENKECIYEKRRQLCLDNKERVAEYMRDYRQRNKERISQRRKAPVQCECGSVIQYCMIARHEQTKKHQEWLKSNSV